MKPVQFFSDAYLEKSRKASATQIAKFLDDYRGLHANAELRVPREPTKLISIRLAVKTLSTLKALGRSKQVPYQTLIKTMIDEGIKNFSHAELVHESYRQK